VKDFAVMLAEKEKTTMESVVFELISMTVTGK